MKLKNCSLIEKNILILVAKLDILGQEILKKHLNRTLVSLKDRGPDNQNYKSFFN